jgi:hypothetical protein
MDHDVYYPYDQSLTEVMGQFAAVKLDNSGTSKDGESKKYWAK